MVATCADLLQLRKNIYIEVSIGKDKQPMQWAIGWSCRSKPCGVATEDNHTNGGSTSYTYQNFMVWKECFLGGEGLEATTFKQKAQSAQL
jgi:hypothetical protein